MEERDDAVRRTRECPRGEWRELPAPMNCRTKFHIRYTAIDELQDNVKQYIRVNFPLTEQKHWLIFQLLLTGRRSRQPFFRRRRGRYPSGRSPWMPDPDFLRSPETEYPGIQVRTKKSPETGDVPGSRIPVAESSLHGCRVNLFSGLFASESRRKTAPLDPAGRCGSGCGGDYL